MLCGLAMEWWEQPKSELGEWFSLSTPIQRQPPSTDVADRDEEKRHVSERVEIVVWFRKCARLRPGYATGVEFKRGVRNRAISNCADVALGERHT